MIIVQGDNFQCGVCVLRVSVEEPQNLMCGRFKRGKVISVPQGEHLYIGSAMNKKRSASLASRLVRHATRTGEKSPHKICPRMIAFFQQIQLGNNDLLPKSPKKAFWNIDYLLDILSVEISGLIAFRTNRKLEAKLGEFLENDSNTWILEKGLGASDIPGNAHFLSLTSQSDRWWLNLPNRLDAIIS